MADWPAGLCVLSDQAEKSILIVRSFVNGRQTMSVRHIYKRIYILKMYLRLPNHLFTFLIQSLTVLNLIMFLSSTTGREFTFKSSHSPNPTSSRNVPPGVWSVIKFKSFCKLLTSNTKHVNNSHFPCEVHRQNLYIPLCCLSGDQPHTYRFTFIHRIHILDKRTNK